MYTITTSTEAALDSKLLTAIKEKKFCIVGCGAVGAAFAEMLVRTGATKIALIDGDKVEIKNLNRVIAFVNDDVGKKKVDVLAERLIQINPDIESPQTIGCMFKEHYPDDVNGQKARDLVVDSATILISTDTNQSRISCEKLCKEHGKEYLSIGVGVDQEKNLAFYECTWKPETPESKKGDEGYGPKNGSFASIVLEAAAVGFNLMLHHLQNPDNPEYNARHKKYLDFAPIKLD